MTNFPKTAFIASLIITSSPFIPNLSAPTLAAEQTYNQVMHDPVTSLNEIKTAADLNAWLNYYYLNPQPDLTPQAVLLMEEQGLLDRPNSRAPLIAIVSQIFAHNPAKLPSLVERLKPLKQPHKSLIWSALWMANTAEAKKQMIIVAQQLAPDAQASITKSTTQPVPIENMEISSPAVLDMLWGSFFTTGDEKYVKRIMTALPLLDSSKYSGEQIIIAAAAKWSLISNACQHKRVLQICKNEIKNQLALKSVLNEIISKALNQSQHNGQKQSVGEAQNLQIKNL